VSNPPLSVICTTGSRRERAAGVIRAISTQTAAEEIELILVDTHPGDLPLQLPPGMPARVVPTRSISTLGQARATGLATARGEAVAFVTDHTRPEPGWAMALISPYHEGPWAAVGYSFSNANPNTYGSRAAMLADFAPWLETTRSSEVTHLAPVDISYRRSALIDLGDDRIEELLTAEPLLLEQLRGRGLRLAMISDARVSHACLRTMGQNAMSSFDYCQALAGIQLRREQWRIGRRLTHALASAFVTPATRTARTIHALAGKIPRRALVISLPGILCQHLLGGLGQGWGYLAGDGQAAGRFLKWQLATERDDR
jgi:glycosyl transferase family 2